MTENKAVVGKSAKAKAKANSKAKAKAKKKEAEIDPRIQKLHEFAIQVDKKFGKGAIGTAHENLVLDMPRIETEIMMLDYALGGGMPRGRIALFYGDKSSGKSTTAMRIVGKAQTLCRNCFRPAKNMKVHSKIVDRGGEKREMFYATAECDCYKKGIFKPSRYKIYNEKTGSYLDVPDKEHKARLKKYQENSFEEMICGLLDIEGTHDKDWAALHGVDNRRLAYYRPETAEEAVDVYDPWLRTGAVDLVVIDTIAFMTPRDEIEKSAEDWQQALQARIIGKLCRKVSSAMAAGARMYGRAPTQIWLNQTRVKIGGYGGSVTPGGKGPGFSASIELRMIPSKPEVDLVKAGNKGEEIAVPLWVDTRFKCEKNKTAPAGIEGFYRILLIDTETRKKGSISQEDQILRYAKHYGIIRKDEDKANLWYYRDKEYRTQAEVHALIMEDKSEMDWLKRRLNDLLLQRG